MNSTLHHRTWRSILAREWGFVYFLEICRLSNFPKAFLGLWIVHVLCCWVSSILISESYHPHVFKISSHCYFSMAMRWFTLYLQNGGFFRFSIYRHTWVELNEKNPNSIQFYVACYVCGSHFHINSNAAHSKISSLLLLIEELSSASMCVIEWQFRCDKIYGIYQRPLAWNELSWKLPSGNEGFSKKRAYRFVLYTVI